MTEKLGKRYSKEIKESILKRMLPPNNEAVSLISEETGITEATLYKWRKMPVLLEMQHLEMDQVLSNGVAKINF
ncbi:transposase [Peribacillus frigoritolerans]|uniref:Transposase n=1 Tax=Peribacillus frigoritolerans TaxID=450367 RepID=A0AAJ1QNU8_9BACI|nr:transposase [Peribacillus frigoritolerans]MDM5284691.1 transposase [Peribacillus frigoritolerans]